MPLADRFQPARLRRLALVALLPVAGCVDPLARVDYIDPSIGDAVAANRAIQTGDPWPRRSFDPDTQSDGARAAADIAKYRTGGPVGDQAAAPITH